MTNEKLAQFYKSFKEKIEDFLGGLEDEKEKKKSIHDKVLKVFNEYLLRIDEEEDLATKKWFEELVINHPKPDLLGKIFANICIEAIKENIRLKIYRNADDIIATVFDLSRLWYLYRLEFDIYSLKIHYDRFFNEPTARFFTTETEFDIENNIFAIAILIAQEGIPFLTGLPIRFSGIIGFKKNEFLYEAQILNEDWREWIVSTIEERSHTRCSIDFCRAGKIWKKGNDYIYTLHGEFAFTYMPFASIKTEGAKKVKRFIENELGIKNFLGGIYLSNIYPKIYPLTNPMIEAIYDEGLPIFKDEIALGKEKGVIFLGEEGE